MEHRKPRPSLPTFSVAPRLSVCNSTEKAGRESLGMNAHERRPTQMPCLRSGTCSTCMLLFGLTLHIVCGKSPYGPESGVTPSSIINQLANHSQL